MKNLLIIAILLFVVETVTSQELTPVAKSHYTGKEISELCDTDIEKINYFYTSSFSINTEHPLYQDFVLEYCKSDVFDITFFSKYRLDDKRNTFESELYPGIKLELHSWQEIKNKYKEIEQ